MTRVAAFAVPAVLLAAPASAQRVARPASAEAFRFCREQEKVGDARACWGVWLQKYRASGTEAEIAYAQAPRAPVPVPASAASARLQLTSTPSSAVTLDGRPLGMTPIDVIEVPPGEHRLAFVNQGRSEGRTITVAALESRLVNVDFDAPPPTQMESPRNAPPARVTMPVADVLDLCSLSPREGTRKERVVLLAPSGSSRVNDDAAIRAVDGARLVREVFAARFAMERFHNVLGSFSGKRGWEQRETLSVAEVQAFVRGARDEGSAESDERVERERPFIGYSLGCADYLAIPSVTSHETKWGAPGAAKELSFTMNGALGIFRRQGDWWKRVALLSASAPSFADATSDRGPGTVTASSGTVPGFPSYVSGVPDPRCVAGKSATDGLPGLVACGTKGEGTFEQALGDRDEHGGTECERARGGNTPDDERMALSVQCAVRSRSFELARGLQEDARKIDGWNLSATVRHASTAPSVSLGRADGMKLGDAFEVVDEHHNRLAFLKAVEVGPGGSAGEAQHTLLRTRLGEAPEGARIDAYPQLGLVVAPYASFAMITYSYGTTRVHSGGEFQDFTLPAMVFGGGATLGFDLSSLLHSTETYARVGAGVFVGRGLNTVASLVPIDLWVEKGFYLGGRFTVAAAAGFTVQNSSVHVLTALAEVEEDLHVSSVMYGPAARLGLDIMLRPEWSVKVDTAVRIPLNSASYTESDGKVIPAEWQSRDDHFATIAVNLGIAKTF